MDELKNKIEETTDLFYQQKVNEAYESFIQLLPQISVFAESLSEEEKREELLGVLAPALEALEQKDSILLADILQYELLEILEDLEA